MRINRYLFILISFITSLILTSCTHKVAVTTAPTIDIHSSYDEKVQGAWAVIVDESSTTFERDISPSSYACWAHSFLFNPGDSIKNSTINALKKVFENIEYKKSTPDIEQMKKENLNGYALVKFEGFNPRIVCRGFQNQKCSVDVDLELGVDVRGRDGKLVGTSVGSRKTVDGKAGSFCGAISELLGEAYKQALGDSLKEMAEKISNSSKIREYTKRK